MTEALGAAALILGLGVGAQWLAHRTHLPGILLLLVAGLVVGPGLGWLDPDALLGDRLGALVGLSVAVILFEGGLGLKFEDIRSHGGVVARLVTLGVLVTGVTAAIAASLLLGLPADMAFVLGAVLVVSGPTVVGPLLRIVRPKDDVAAVLRWEGILVDPIGALLAVLVFEAFFHGGPGEALDTAAVSLLKTVGAGLAVGVPVAAAWVLAEKRKAIPDHLGGAVGLGFVVLAYAASEALSPESGLLAVTLLGVALANQRVVSVRHILDFKEELSQVLLGSLFIILSARLDRSDLLGLDWHVGLFVAVLVLVARPLAVLVSTWGSGLDARSRVFLAWMAPRGIVAAAVSAFFALRLERLGRPGAELFVPVTFAVILGTVLLYGLTARPVAAALGVGGREAHGVLLVGANQVARTVAKSLRELGLPVVLIDNDAAAVTAARLDDLDARRVRLLDPGLEDELDLEGVGNLWAVTADDESNALAAVRFADLFGRDHVAQVATTDEEDEATTRHLRGRPLFEGLTYRRLRGRLSGGWQLRRTPMTDRFGMAEHRKQHPDAVPLYVVTAEKRLRGVGAEPRPGDTLVALVPAEAEAGAGNGGGAGVGAGAPQAPENAPA